MGVLERANVQEWVEDKQSKNERAGIPGEYINTPTGKQTVNSKDHRELPGETACLRAVSPIHFWGRKWPKYCHQSGSKKRTVQSTEQSKIWFILHLNKGIHLTFIQGLPDCLISGVLNPLEVNAWFLPLCCYLEAKDFHFW